MWWRRHPGWRWRAALLLALAALLALRVPAASELAAELRAPPQKLAAHLADFNSLRSLYPHISSSWKLESQWSNYTSWRYSLSFSCGARCAGAAHVRAHDEYAAGPAHGSAQAHRGDFTIQTCRTLPLFSWPDFCEELEVEWFVSGGKGEEEGAARYVERARSRRALGAALLAWLGGGGGLAAARAGHLRVLRETFH
ncbi:uncharacterized protein LOC134650778 [Cydia amplana]|uniref:uncharacterized protein LOC134650778 n=1 Tax=Cydia amplana TaxID=1869771 RepID=UPI002FE6A24B